MPHADPGEQTEFEARQDWINSGNPPSGFNAWWQGIHQNGATTVEVPKPGPTALVPTDPSDPIDDLAVDVQPGLDWLQTQESLALEKYIAELNAQVQREATAAQKEVAEINAAARAASDASFAALQKQLQAGQISADKYIEEQRLIQQESEFARNHALNLRAQAHQEKIDDINAEIARAQEYREERLLHAELAASPSDVVLYEFFKRGMGMPEVLAETAGGAGTGAQLAGTLGGFLNGGTLSGQDYAAPPPAYSDEALQQLMTSVFGTTPGAGYNPQLKGTGAFGAEIKAPSEISRAQFLGMDPSQLGILTSFLKGGIQLTPGDDASRVSINPEDWLAQMVKSFIPTIDAASSGITTQYRA